jgi:hypothetical protein
MENQVDELDKKIDEVHQTLSNTSVELASLFWDIPPEKQLNKPSSDEWSALEILVHLRQVSDVYAHRVKRVMTNETDDLIRLKDYDENKLLSKITLADETAKSNINEFMNSRSDLLNRISLIDKSEWKKKLASHEIHGELTLLELLIPLADREIKFLKKLEQIFENVESEEPELSIDMVHAILSNTSIELSQLFWGVPREVQLQRFSDSDWSPLEILIHLRLVAEVFAERVKRAMHPDNKEIISLHDYDEQKQMEKIDLEEESVRGNITAFMKARSELLNKVSLIDTEIWDKRVAKHEIKGEQTLLQLLIPLAQRETRYLNKLKEYLKDYY